MSKFLKRTMRATGMLWILTAWSAAGGEGPGKAGRIPWIDYGKAIREAQTTGKLILLVNTG